MRVLVACEFSGIVRDSFKAKGHDAWSCDLLPTEREGNHYQCDVGAIIDMDWDLMIAHPPCTHLAVSGAKYFAEKRKDGRQQKAIDFFMLLALAPIRKIAIENPVGIMSTIFRKPNQIIQPWQFGEDASKKTCLWLKNVPALVHTRIIKKPFYSNQTGNGQNKVIVNGKWIGFNNPLTAKERSRTYQGIADAMAEQWG